MVGGTGGSLYRLRLTSDRLHVDVSGDPRLADRVADSTGKFGVTESETLLIGTNFGITPSIEQGPDGNLYVVSNTDGIIYRISRVAPRVGGKDGKLEDQPRPSGPSAAFANPFDGNSGQSGSSAPVIPESRFSKSDGIAPTIMTPEMVDARFASLPSDEATSGSSKAVSILSTDSETDLNHLAFPLSDDADSSLALRTATNFEESLR
jgi:hypothetical protein